MALLKEISRIPLHSEIFKHWEINYGQFTPNHQPICHIMIYRLNTRYYIELSGWYTGKHIWSASSSSSLLDLYFEVKAIADERTFRSLKDYERRGKLWHRTDKLLIGGNEMMTNITTLWISTIIFRLWQFLFVPTLSLIVASMAKTK